MTTEEEPRQLRPDEIDPELAKTLRNSHRQVNQCDCYPNIRVMGPTREREVTAWLDPTDLHPDSLRPRCCETTSYDRIAGSNFDIPSPFVRAFEDDS